MSLGTLTIDLAANLAGLESDLGRARRVWESNARKYEQMAVKIGKSIAAAAGPAVIAGLTKAAIDNADAMYKQSQITGVQIGELSKLAHAGKGADVEFSDLTGALGKFNKGIVAAAEGTGAQAEAFNVLGINIKKSDGSLKTTNELFGEVAQSFTYFEDGARKSSIAQDLFGKSGAALIPLLNGGKQGLKAAGDELERVGGVLDEKTGKAAEKFNGNIHALNTSIAHMGTIIARDTIEPLSEFSDLLSDPQTQKNIASIASGLISMASAAAKSVVGLASLTVSLKDYADGLENGFDDGDIANKLKRLATIDAVLKKDFLSAEVAFGAKPGDFIAKEAELLKERAALLKSIAADQQKLLAPKMQTEDVWSRDADEAEQAEALAKRLAKTKETEDAEKRVIEIQKKAREEAARFKEGLNSELAAMRERATLGMNATELQKIQYRTLHGDLAKATAQTVALFEAEAKRIDLVAEQQKADEAAKKIAEDREVILESLMTGEQRINKAYDEKIETVKKWGKTEEETSEIIGNLNKKRMEELEKETNQMSEITKNMYRDMQSGIGDAIYDGLSGRKTDILQVFEDMIKKMIAQAIAADIMGAVFPGIGGAAGGGGVGALFAGVAGLFGGGKAVGGPVTSGKFYEVGENNRPELFASGGRQFLIPGNSGRVGAVGGGSSNVIHINMSGIKDSREARQAAGAVSRAVAAGISRAQRYT
jgi:hypothetical protein